MKSLVITLLEAENSECPNIGTITSSPIDEETLKSKFVIACERHFDAIVIEIRVQDGLKLTDVEGGYPLMVYVSLDGGYEAIVEATQTWLY